MADTFTSGTAGRVRVGASDTIVAGLTKWTLRKVHNVVRIPHFESTADSDGLIHPNHLKGLGGPHTGTLEGYFNSDATNKTDGTTVAISNGLTVVLDLLITRAPLGFISISVTITELVVEVAVENQPARFTASFEVDGDPERTAGS
jgi:hypothetical protein